MIAQALRLLTTQLRQYIADTDTVEDPPDATEPPDPYVVLGNIALADVPDLSPPIRQRTVLSMVNAHEETTFKNAAHYERNGTTIRYRNAPVHMNLFLLFSANYDLYENALVRLSQVIEFFQGKNVFTFLEAPIPEFVDTEELVEQMAEVRLILDLYTLSFEQINYLWGSLGGKQVPSVMYKMRLVRLEADRTLAAGRLIEEIESREDIF